MQIFALLCLLFEESDFDADRHGDERKACILKLHEELRFEISAGLPPKKRDIMLRIMGEDAFDLVEKAEIWEYLAMKVSNDVVHSSHGTNDMTLTE